MSHSPIFSCLLKSSLLALALILPSSFLACGLDTAPIQDPAAGRADTQTTLERVSVITTVHGTLAATTAAGEGLQAPYPGAKALLTQLRLCQTKSAEELFFIAGPEQDLPMITTWLQDNKFPEATLPEGERSEAMAKILKSLPEHRFVIIADEPQLLQQLQADFSAQILGVLLMVSPQEQEQVAGAQEAPTDSAAQDTLPPVENFAQAAAMLLQLKILGEAAARQVMAEARDQGLEMSGEQIDELIDAHRPAPAQVEIQELITMATPRYKSGGKPTEVIFRHLAHSGEDGGGCDTCHTTIADELNAESNTKKLVHKSCKTCHAKGKPAKSFRCKSCHTAISE